MKTVILIVLLLVATTSYASQKAITDTGEEVILKNNGTWKYIDNSKNALLKITTNKKTFKKSIDATFLLKSTRNNSAYWVDTKKWSFKKATKNDEAEYEFRLKGTDVYGLALSEAIPIKIESLVDIAFDNAREAAPDIEITNKEYRIVNGKKVIFMEMNGTMQGMEVTFMGYYFSDASGSTQFLTYTATSLIDKYISSMMDMLNGLTIQ